MEYTATKFEDQNLMFHIVADNNGEKVEFNVVCAQSESEVPELVAHHLDFLNNPPVIAPVQQSPSPDLTSLVQQQQSLIESLTARIAALEGAAQ